MATQRTFQAMLNEYLAYDLLMEELTKRTYVINKVEKDQKWKGGKLPVPFRGANASSIKYGGLTDLADISEYEFVRGHVDDYKEIWGTMKWNARDLMEHNGKVNEASFLKNLPDQLEDFIDGMKQAVSVNLLVGAAFCALTADGTVGGLITVDHPERLTKGQKVLVKITAGTTVTGYVKDININTGTAHLYTDRTYATVVDCSAMLAASGAKCYIDGATTSSNVFTSIRDQLLPSAQGGSATIFNVTKTDYPYTQAIAYDATTGGAISASNILYKIFDAWTFYKQRGKATTDAECLISYKHLGNVMKALETQAGAFKNVDTKVNFAGYTEITVVGVQGALKIIGVHEMPNDVCFFIDWKCLKLHSNGFFEKQTSPEGISYYTVRDNTNGYSYIVDVKFYGELIVHKPTGCAVVYNFDY